MTQREVALRKKKTLWLIAFAVVVVGFAGLVVTTSSLRWRAELISLKATGQLIDMGWAEVFEAIGKNPPYNVRQLLTTRNPHRAFRNPYDSASDIENGSEAFAASCAACHGPDGRGVSAPDLTSGHLRYGNSDLQLFRTISGGIPETAMVGVDLPDRTIWRIVAFIRSITTGDFVETVTVLPDPAVTPAMILGARTDEPHNWLTYSGSYDSKRYSFLDQITADNAGRLVPVWIRMLRTRIAIESSPLVVDGIMYVTEPPATVVAMDAATGKVLWSVTRDLPRDLPSCCGPVNRGLAILGHRVFMGTMDGHLTAFDARSGKLLWEVEVGDHRTGHSITVAPLALSDRIIVGISGGEFGIRGFVDAYDPETGERLWRFYTIPGPGEPGHDTWEGDSWRQGGGPTWVTGSYDPELDLLYWGVGNPGPPFSGSERQGDNLYSNSVVALDPGTGELVWHFQFTPHDTHDWDANQVPVLADIELDGEVRQLMLWANRNAFYYVLDRATGEYISGTEFTTQTWADGLDANGRPLANALAAPSDTGTLVYPSGSGATNWWSPSFSPHTGLMYVPINEGSAAVFFSEEEEFVEGAFFMGSGGATAPGVAPRKKIIALNAETGDRAWEYEFPFEGPGHFKGLAGILSTQGGVLFAGAEEYFVVLDAMSGREIRGFNVGGRVHAAPITYTVSGRQYVAIAIGNSIVAFSLRE